MNINIWDVADDIEQLIQSPRPVDLDDLANPRHPARQPDLAPTGPVPRTAMFAPPICRRSEGVLPSASDDDDGGLTARLLELL